MKKIITSCLALVFCALLGAQNLEEILSSIQQNNPTLVSLSAARDAAKLEAKTGLAPSDPNVDFNYFWETKAPQGHRVNVGVSQSFDFPTVYYWRKKISKGESRAADLEYALGRKTVLLEAERTCIELAFYNALGRELQRCERNAETVSQSYKQKFEAGEIGILDYNNAKLQQLSAKKKWLENEASKSETLAALVRLNGGKEIEYGETDYPFELLPSDFDSWYESAVSGSVELQALENEKTLASNSLRLERNQWIPKFSLGYASEMIPGSSLQGLSAGLSIPLWENHGRVKAARSRQEASVTRANEAYFQYQSSLRAKYAKALSLQELALQYKTGLGELGTTELLMQALQGGEISLETYIIGVDSWYDSFVEALECERDARLLVAEVRNFAR